MRESGFYWVKVRDYLSYEKGDFYRDWVPAYWNGEDKTWDMIRSDCPTEDEEVFVGGPLLKMASTPLSLYNPRRRQKL